MASQCMSSDKKSFLKNIGNLPPQFQGWQRIGWPRRRLWQHGRDKLLDRIPASFRLVELQVVKIVDGVADIDCAVF